MKLLTILTATLALVTVPAWSAKADSAKDLQKLLTTNRCEGCDLSGANLIGIDLSNAQLQGAKLNAANLSGADLSGANLSKVSAVGTSLMGANLRKATLVKASLIYANLAKAQLNDAILQGTDLQGANLVGADLNGAKITESDFVGANLAEIKRSQPWSTADKNRFQGEARVAIDGKPTVIEREVEPAAPIDSPLGSVLTVPNPPITVPGNGNGTSQDNTQTNTVTGNRNSNVIRGGRNSGGSNRNDQIDDGVVGGAGSNTIPRVVPPVTRGGRDSIIESRRRPQKIRRRFSIPAWVGFTQTSTTGGDRYHDPNHPDSILELW
jgi:Pentapeptide repeats (8 copies)